MWFKTRTGLYSVTEPLEIRVAKYTKGKKPNYSIYARSLHDVDVQYKGVFGSLKAPGRSIYLAQFELEDSSQPEIAQCMRLIEAAIATDAKICDLSAVGYARTWSDNGWSVIEW